VNKDEVRDVCHLARQRKLSYNISLNRASMPFDMFHMDIWGPYSTPLIHMHTYFLTIADDYSRYT
jgi:transcriptional regulator of aromatic amino acid metabolism